MTCYLKMKKPLVRQEDQYNLKPKQMKDLAYICEPMMSDAYQDMHGNSVKSLELGAFAIDVDEEGAWLNEVVKENGLDWSVLDNQAAVNRMKERGYDSTMVDEGDGVYSYCVFSPEQIRVVSDKAKAMTAAGPVKIEGDRYGKFKFKIQHDWHEYGDEVEEGDWNMAIVHAFDTTQEGKTEDGKWAGSVDFAIRDGHLESSNTEVDPEFQRQGLATAMYVFAENEIGMKAVPHRDQSPAGQALWRQKDRPFGMSWASSTWKDEGLLNESDMKKWKRYWDGRGHSIQIDRAHGGLYHCWIKFAAAPARALTLYHVTTKPIAEDIKAHGFKPVDQGMWKNYYAPQGRDGIYFYDDLKYSEAYAAHAEGKLYMLNAQPNTGWNENKKHMPKMAIIKVQVPEGVAITTDQKEDGFFVPTADLNKIKITGMYKFDYIPTEGRNLGEKFGADDMKPRSKYDKVCHAIATDDALYSYFGDYVQCSDAFEDRPTDSSRVVELVKSIPPFIPPTQRKCLYRGETIRMGDDREPAKWEPHLRDLLSWSVNYDTARGFAEARGIVWQTVGKIQGIALGDIVRWRNWTHPNESNYEGMQAEWFVLNTCKAREADWQKTGSDRSWTLEQAEAFLKSLPLVECGYRGKIVGGVANNGQSSHDLDILLEAIIEDFDFEKFLNYFESIGADAQPTHNGDDELWEVRLASGQVVDFFFGDGPTGGKTAVWRKGIKRYKLYHGQGRFDDFDPARIPTYFTNNKKYAKDFGDVVIEAYVTFNNPLVLDAMGGGFEAEETHVRDAAWRQEQIKKGYDGLIVVGSDASNMPQIEAYIPFSPNQIELIEPICEQSYKTSAADLETQLKALAPQLAAAAQGVYDKWDASDETYGDAEVGMGGICHLIVDAMADVVSQIPNVSVMPFSHDMGEVHVSLSVWIEPAEPVIPNDWNEDEDGQFEPEDERVELYDVDIPPYTYETGGGYNWKKIPDVTFDASDIVLYRQLISKEDLAALAN
jgi:hypothetical protein